MTILYIIIFSFIGGFIDAVVGGGGLIQMPALLVNLPNVPLPTLFGTNKIAALAGTSIAATQYAKQIKFNVKLLFIVSFFAAIASYTGAKAVSYIEVKTLKPVVLIILILIAVYTFFKKDLGAVESKVLTPKKLYLLGSLIGVIIGFYDGFFGPGTGSFLVLGFVVVLGFNFLQASAYAKIINCITNIAALVVFIKNGNYILNIAIFMALANILGSLIGTKMALKNGNQFVRTIFLFIVLIMILRYSYDVFFLAK